MINIHGNRRKHIVSMCAMWIDWRTRVSRKCVYSMLVHILNDVCSYFALPVLTWHCWLRVTEGPLILSFPKGLNAARKVAW